MLLDLMMKPSLYLVNVVFSGMWAVSLMTDISFTVAAHRQEVTKATRMLTSIVFANALISPSLVALSCQCIMGYMQEVVNEKMEVRYYYIIS